MSRRTALLAAVLALAGSSLIAGVQRGRAAGSGAGSPVTFVRATSSAGLAFVHTNGASAEKHLVETMGSGGVFFDYDKDAWVDLLLVDGGSLVDPAIAAQARPRLYHNQGDGTFADVTAGSGIVQGAYGMGACAADYDNDGLTDLYITAFGPNALYRNVGNGRFTDVTSAAGVGAPGWSTSCAFSDIDRDGDVDLFVVNYVDDSPERNPYCGDPSRRLRVYCHPLNYEPLASIYYRNDGSGRFADASIAAGVHRFTGNGLGIVIADYDDDEWPDVFVANDTTPNFLFHNDGDGTFTERGLLAGVAVARDGKVRAGMGTDFGDVDGDGWLDLVVTNHEFETHSLFRNDRAGAFTDVTVSSGIGPATLPYVGFGTAFFDYDNDADLDLAIINGHVIDNTAMFRSGSTHAQRRLLFRNDGSGRFAEIGAAAGEAYAAEGVGRTLLVADIDNDGDLDLLATNNGAAPDLLVNQGDGHGNALLIRLRATQGNRDAIGARLRITAGGRTQVREITAGSSYLGQQDLRVHVGLGPAASVDRIDIRWPNGRAESIPKTAVNQLITVTEGAGVTAAVPLVR